MGFNAYKPGRIRGADLAMLGAAVAVIVGMVLWVWLG